MNWTEEQQQIIDFASNSKAGSLLVEAGAGCAKTSTGKAAMQRIKTVGAGFAFNKRNADDLQKAFPASFSCKSFNAWGHGAWARALPEGTRLQVDSNKLGKLCNEVSKEFKTELDSDQWQELRKLVSASQQTGLVLKGDEWERNGLISDELESWELLCDGVGIITADQPMQIELAREVLKRNVNLARQGVISFDDQVYCSVLLGGKFPQYPVGFVDEDQDLSRLNILMVTKCLRPDGRLFAVGDKRQAIYLWRGATAQSAEGLKQSFPSNWAEAPLMTTFRCPKSVVLRQQGHVPGFRSAEGNAEGRVVVWQPTADKELTWDGWGWEDVEKLAEGRKPVILCRNNGPLVSMAIKLLRRSVGCFMIGRDIGKGLISVSKKIVPEDSTPRQQTQGRIVEWRQQEVELAQANQKQHKLESIYDRADCLLAVLEGAECQTAGDLRLVIGNLYSRESGQVELSSIHRAKGMEWDVVVHLDPWRIPSKWAKKNAAEGRYEEIEQEYNLRYVCETRTKNTLVLADLESFR